MRWTVISVAALAFALVLSGTAVAIQPRDAVRRANEFTSAAPNTTAEVWYDDLESGAVGWTHGDASGQTIYWHIDSYMAYSGNSWWCGTFDYDANGGYGNLWKQYLTSPQVAWGGLSTYPALMFVYRCDSEAGFDFTYVQADSLGSWVDLNRGFDGVRAWGPATYYLGDKSDPAKVRFFFTSDGGYSDQDGQYLSIGGGVAVDDIQILDYYTYDVLFLDDADANVFMTPSVPPAAGDFWHLADDNSCQDYSPTHYWSVTSPDTSAVPPNLVNWLQTPIIDIDQPEFEEVQGCTLWVIFQFWMPEYWGGGWQEFATQDNGVTWTMVGNWYGDQCGYSYGPCSHFLFYIPIIDDLFPAAGIPDMGGRHVGVRWQMVTDAYGNYSDPACSYLSAGITIDDCWIEVTPRPTAVERATWGHIKSLFR
jgi:hypothetical protein